MLSEAVLFISACPRDKKSSFYNKSKSETYQFSSGLPIDYNEAGAIH